MGSTRASGADEGQNFRMPPEAAAATRSSPKTRIYRVSRLWTTVDRGYIRLLIDSPVASYQRSPEGPSLAIRRTGSNIAGQQDGKGSSTGRSAQVGTRI